MVSGRGRHSSNTSDGAALSRSGRVRKRSSKFADFESPDDIEMEFKKKNEKSSKFSKSKDGEYDEEMSDDDLETRNDTWSDSDELNEEDDADGGISKESNYSQANSLYFSEKSKRGSAKHRVRKSQRKDKGMHRCTAYMLWAREMRPSIIETFPDMDFAAINQRLGDMWALVPNAQKLQWKRKAKKASSKGDPSDKKASTYSTSKGFREGKANVLVKGGPSKGSGRGRGGALEINIPPQTKKTPDVSSFSQTALELSPPASYKVTGCAPVDVAAHLKLLGESLNNIGQKLKEHEGQIAVSGSLSVLLDSMLCVLGPLTCLTNQVEELNGAVPEGVLTGILDNIAYIMPGIV